MPLYSSFKGLYFAHVYWVATALPQELHTFCTFQVSLELFVFALLQSLLATTVMGLIASRVYATSSSSSSPFVNNKSRFD